MQGILHSLCPRCRTGKIFRKSLWLFPSMYERCAVCGLKYEREPGYFLGAMYFGYALGVATLAPLVVLVWFVFKWSLVKCIVVGAVLFLPFTPVLSYLARVLWIYMDQAVDPDRTGWTES